MRKALSLLCLSLLLAAPAFPASGTNAVVVFYEDGSYKIDTWANVRELMDGRRTIALHVQHVQSPSGGLPNVVGFGGFDVTAARAVGTNLMVRSVNKAGAGAPGEAKQSIFFSASPFNQTIQQVLTIPWEAASGGMDAVWSEVPFGEPNSAQRTFYDNLSNCSNTWTLALRDDAVPSTGQFFDTQLGTCISPP